MKMPTSQSDTFFISKYGHRKIIYIFAAFLLLYLFDLHFFAFLALLCLGFTLFVYRNPEREIPYLQSKSVLSPVDGKVVAIEDSTDGYKITVASSITDVSILRAVVSSDVSIVKKEGAMLTGSIKKSNLLNTQATVTFTNDEKIVVCHIAGRSLESFTVQPLQEAYIVQGGRYGYMNGGMTYIHLPASARLSIQLFERVKAGETLLGYTA